MNNSKYVQQFPTTGSGDEYVVLEPDGRIRLSTQLREGLFDGADHVSIFKDPEGSEIVIKPMDLITPDDRVELSEAGQKNSKRYFAITGSSKNKSYIINANRVVDVVQAEKVTLTVSSDPSGQKEPEGNQEPRASEYQLKGYKYQMRRCNELVVHRKGNEHKDLGKCVIIPIKDCVDDKMRYKSEKNKTVKAKLVEEYTSGWD